jgi:Fic family protein
VRMPRRPPPQNELRERVEDRISVLELLSRVQEPIVNGDYLHWDRLRYLTPPDSLDHEAWWYALRIRRLASSRSVPLRDKLGSSFNYNLADPLPGCLHHVDSLARGAIQQPEPVTNPETRDSYLVRSLIEESITSSQLEGASTTREIAKEMIRDGRQPRDRGERMIFNNYQTMMSILELKNQEMTRDLLFGIHRLVTDGTLENPSAAGRFRVPSEDIVVGDDRGEVFHTPPPAEELERRLDEMCKFANGVTPEGFIHPMVRSIILHFWLAYDHPFVDGNGRTARALFYWSMLRQGYWLFEYISISNIILKAPVRYGRAFLHTETDENDLTYFLIYHAEVIRKAIDELYAHIDRRTRQLTEAQKQLRGLTTLNSRQRELIGHALRHPGHRYTIESHRNSHKVVYETARSDLMDLESRGLLQKRKSGKTWIFTPSQDLEAKLGRDDVSSS